MPKALSMQNAASLWTRESLDARRSAIAAAHAKGAAGADVVRALADLADEVLLNLYNAGSEAQAEQTGVCLVALGGYGRRELAPYSDIDVMFLYAPSHATQGKGISTRVLHGLWDLGFQVGHSLRSVEDCLSLGQGDLIVRTSLMEARGLAGDQQLFEQFARTFRERVTSKAVGQFMTQKLEERRAEYARFGVTNFLLEPNVKKSRGGLRDYHLLQWIALARYGLSSIHELVAEGKLASGDAAALSEAHEFLRRVRNELHFYAGRAQDILTFDEQLRIAGHWEFVNAPHLLSVEKFMQQYYRHSTRISDVTTQFVSGAMTRSFWRRIADWLPARQIEGFFILTRDEITVPAALRQQFLSDGTLILRLFQLAQLYGLSIAHELLQIISERLMDLPDSAFWSEDSGSRFLAILAGPARVAEILTLMHRVRLLERLIPAFGPVRGLMQFNAYHKFTVDHHSLLAVEQAEEIGTGDGLLAQVYHEIKRKDVLHLAVLLHDIGKGQSEDHSLVGERIAREAAERLRLGEHESRLLMFLVRYHLLMSHTAFRRDPNDEKVVLGFARAVGTVEALKMLYVLTAADISAVGPDVLTRWKETLLSELYLKTLQELSGEEESPATNIERLKDENRKAVVQRTQGSLPSDWVRRQLTAWPERSLALAPADKIAAQLDWVWRLQNAPVLVDTRYEPALRTTEFTVYTRDGFTPGIFSKISGVLAAKGLQILDAQISTLADGIVVDVFHVSDGDYSAGPPAHRLADVREAIVAVLEGRWEVEALLQDAGRYGAERQGVPLREPTVVQIDNETSDRYTIIDVFADDRQGLLYILTRAMFELGLSVHAARISTKLDQIVDVFYVTDRSGAKIDDPVRCQVITETMTAQIEDYLSGTRTTRPILQRATCT
jgi:[protein-PII] uridylyltransferase